MSPILVRFSYICNAFGTLNIVPDVLFKAQFYLQCACSNWVNQSR